MSSNNITYDSYTGSVEGYHITPERVREILSDNRTPPEKPKPKLKVVK